MSNRETIVITNQSTDGLYISQTSFLLPEDEQAKQRILDLESEAPGMTVFRMHHYGLLRHNFIKPDNTMGYAYTIYNNKNEHPVAVMSFNQEDIFDDAHGYYCYQISSEESKFDILACRFGDDYTKKLSDSAVDTLFKNNKTLFMPFDGEPGFTIMPAAHFNL